MSLDTGWQGMELFSARTNVNWLWVVVSGFSESTDEDNPFLADRPRILPALLQKDVSFCL